MDFTQLVTLPDEVQIQVTKNGQMPVIGSDGAAGLDCFNLSDIELRPHTQMNPLLVSLGFHIAIPKGWVGLLVPRSSTFKKYRLSLANTIGVIDSDYRGEVMANIIMAPVVDNKYMQTIPAGTRLCQLVLMPCADYSQMKVKQVDSVEELGTTARGDGGFGSTDTIKESCGASGQPHQFVRSVIDDGDEVTDYYKCINCGAVAHKRKVDKLATKGLYEKPKLVCHACGARVEGYHRNCPACGAVNATIALL
jgi:dUTP pyrophosphatase